MNGLGRQSLPEWHPSRERKSWYPRNAGFKRIHAEEELHRMLAHYRAQGLPDEAVDSIYQKKGTREWTEYERRNGFDHEKNPSGDLTEQHPIGNFALAKLSSISVGRVVPK